MAIEFAQLVRRDLANETGAAAERGDACCRVACRAAADLVSGAHVGVVAFGLQRLLEYCIRERCGKWTTQFVLKNPNFVMSGVPKTQVSSLTGETRHLSPNPA